MSEVRLTLAEIAGYLNGTDADTLTRMNAKPDAGTPESMGASIFAGYFRSVMNIIQKELKHSDQNDAYFLMIVLASHINVLHHIQAAFEAAELKEQMDG